MNTLRHVPGPLHLAQAPRRTFLRSALAASASLLTCQAPAWSRSRSAGLPIPLAMEAPPDVDPAGHLVSEKYDGVRALWDGQRLRFRSGLPIWAPEDFLAQLPPQPLDGELWMGHGRFEALSAAVRRHRPDAAEWRALRYQVFDLPAAEGGFAQRHLALLALLADGTGRAEPALLAVPQWAIADRVALARRLEAVLAVGGEGLVLRRADALYLAGRGTAMLKLKPLQDAEAWVIGHEPGRGRHAGRLGALRLRDDAGREFSLGTGFSDAERAAPPAIGQRVTYAYRGRTAEGLPRFASFVRRRPEGL